MYVPTFLKGNIIMKHTQKISLALVIMMVLMMALAVIPASAEEAAQETTYVFEATELEAAAAGTFTDGQQVTAGTNGYFTLIMSAKTKIDGSSKTWSDGYTSGRRINFGGFRHGFRVEYKQTDNCYRIDRRKIQDRGGARQNFRDRSRDKGVHLQPLFR